MIVSNVGTQITGLYKRFIAKMAFERLLVCVETDMIVQVTGLGEGSVAVRTFERLFT